jgi:hypothetical protein
VDNELIDIGIVAACVPKLFRRFVNRINFDMKGKWMRRIQFLVIRYKCTDPTVAMIELPDTIRGYPVVSSDSTVDLFTRSSNINQLYRLVRPNARLLVVDIDMLMTEEVLKSVLSLVKPGVAYFPIVWSKYSPKHVKRTQKEVQYRIPPFNLLGGMWRVYGFGMFCMHQQDLARFPMDESFKGWGGEDNEFFERVQRDASVTAVREQEKGLVHLWHDKVCSEILKDPKKRMSCLGSRASNMG